MHLFASVDLEEQITSFAIDTVSIAALALFVCTILAVLLNSHGTATLKKIFKLPLFIMMSLSMVVSTLILIGGTVYLNVNSDSGGPVHWHAGIEYWVCDTELNLRDPIGFLSNKVGSATFHEHNDKYMHLEGVVVDKSYDASLEKFMAVAGGYITDGSIGIPLTDDQSKWPVTGDQFDGDTMNMPVDPSFPAITANGERLAQTEDGPVLRLQNGDACSESGVDRSELQVFVYTFNEEDETYSQQKIESPGSYTMRDESTLGPPGDCVIVEFAPPKAATDKLCEQYGIKDVERCESFGVSEFNPELCYIREVNKPVEPQPQSEPAPEPTPDVTEQESVNQEQNVQSEAVLTDDMPEETTQTNTEQPQETEVQ